MKRLPIALKEKAILLRRNGHSVKEISDELDIAQSTSSMWVKGLILNQKAKERIIGRRLIGYHRAAAYWKEKNIQEEQGYKLAADKLIDGIKRSEGYCKVFCALLYWCEGGKSQTSVGFTNSDPLLIKTFIALFRKSFAVDEQKFRVLMHLHAYHNEKSQKNFWSDLTGIPKYKFQKTYLKANSRKRIREGYQGCISIKYYDAKVLKELKAIYNSFCENIGE